MEKYVISHHGIKGQRWGVRRYQNADGSLTAAGKKRYNSRELKNIREERSNLYDRYTKDNEDYKKAQKLEEEAWRLYDTHKFDGDDGGGGETEEDDIAGKRYMELWDEIEKLRDSAEESAWQKAQKEIVDKYGDKAIQQIQTQNNIELGARVLTATLAVYGYYKFVTS